MKAEAFAERYGPYALVAGGSIGLGAAFAEGLARRGVNLVLIARDAARLEATAARLRGAYGGDAYGRGAYGGDAYGGEAHGVDVVAVAADMADWDVVKKRVAELKVPIGLLVYDAAFAPIGPFAGASEDDLARAAAVNVKGPLLLAKLLSAPMIDRGRGGIILMSSLAGAQGSPKLAAYAATKSFNVILAEGLWKELKPRGVDVLVCVAGAISTPGYEAASTAKRAPGTLAPAVVAETALKALGRGPVVVPGATNKVGRFVMTRLLSRRAAIGVMARNTGGLS